MLRIWVNVLIASACFAWALPPAETSVVEVGKRKVHVAQWGDLSSEKPAVVLLSGPTDQWNSDSAWFARIAPHLAMTHRVIAIDRPGQVLGETEVRLGYASFAEDVAAVFDYFKLKDAKVMAFASSNITLNLLFHKYPDVSIAGVMMIDPDVLTPFSIERYTSDAQPFKENLVKYLEYIQAGKYADRATEKNRIERKLLEALAQSDEKTDWDYVQKIFKARLSIASLKNLFSEIAIYDQDLRKAEKVGFPKSVPLVIFDTDFEQAYIDKSQDAKAIEGLKKWREDGKHYYQALVKAASTGRYIPVDTQEHLLPFSHPELLVEAIREM